MRNWKTNLGGALSSFGLAVVAIDPAWGKYGLLIAAVGTALTGLFARDYNVSTEQSLKTQDAKDKTA